MNNYFFSIMAKSKSGGTRSLIRGRVASDVYSIGRDAMGKRQQVVRSLAEVVSNPRTLAQMRSRMIMSTVMQAQSALKVIIDHSFDNVAGVQPNLSEFIRRNYALVKADVANHPSGGNKFGLVAYQGQGAKQGAYIVSDGKAAFPAAVTFVQSTAIMTIALTGESATFGALKEAWEVGNDGYLTIVGINASGTADYARLHLASNIADSTIITSDNLASCFNIEGDANPVLAIAGQNITITMSSIAGCSSVIVTRKVASGFIHSKAVLGAAVDLPYNADAALPSYPIGEQKFLNGGDSQGASAPVSPTPTPTPEEETPEVVEAHLTTFSVAGANLLTGTSQTNQTGEKAINAVLANKDASKSYALVHKTSGTYTVGENASDNAVAFEGDTLNTTATLEQDGSLIFALTEDGKVKQVLGKLTYYVNPGGGMDQN